MLKYIYTIILSMAVFGASHAQYGQNNFYAGIKGGLNYSSLNTKVNSNTKTGFHGGGFATLKLSNVAIQSEILFSQQGAQLTLDGQDIDANYSYLNIPVLLKLYVAGGFNIHMGPQFGYIRSANRVFKGDKQDYKERLKESEISLAMGAGWDLPMGLTIEGRYNLGLTEIYKYPSQSTAAKNQVFQISLGYRLLTVLE